MPDGSVECVLGQLQADTANMRATLEEMREDIRRMERGIDRRMDHAERRLRTIEDTILTARVGWRAVIVMGSAIATVTGAIAGVIHYFYDPLLKLAKSLFG